MSRSRDTDRPTPESDHSARETTVAAGAPAPGDPGPSEQPLPRPGPGRRQLLLAGTAGAGVLGAGAAALGLDRAMRRAGSEAAGAGEATGSPPLLHGSDAVPFHGAHQAGVETPAQASATFVGLDLREQVDRDGALRMLQLLTDDAARLTQGQPALADTEPELAQQPARLTVTVGFGPGLLARAEVGAPTWLSPLPPFEIDQLEPELGDGDLMLQIAADDPLTVSHATRMLMKDARAFTTVRWVQNGFRRALGTQRPETTQRNLFGQLDGSANAALGSDHFSRVVWIDQGPFAGGTSMVIRRIRMDLDGWDEVDRLARENSTGTRLDTGGPLTGGDEFADAQFSAVSDHGFPVIPEFAHMRRANGIDEGEHQEIFRRAYHYELPPPEGSEALSEAGQIFVSFQADVLGQFVPIQQRLSDLDLLNQWTTPIGSAVFAIPPGCAEGEYLGQSVLE